MISGEKSKFEKVRKGLGEYFFEQAEKYADNIFQIDGETGEKETFSSVNKRSSRLAINLKKLGLTTGNIVITCLKNNLNSAIPHIAVLYCGAIFAALDPIQTEKEWIHCLNLVKPKIIFVDEEHSEKMEKCLGHLEVKSVMIIVGQSGVHKTLEELLVLGPSEYEDNFHPEIIQDCYSTAVISFSSGTTGLPKGVCHCHFGLINMVINYFDECTFIPNGNVNKQNCWYWSDANLHRFREGHTQYPEKLNVWVGIVRDAMIGPLFIPGNSSGDIHLYMLENSIEPLIVHELENQRDDQSNLAVDEDLLLFQQDGAPPHYAVSVRHWLDTHYPNKWFGKRGPIEWPPRSPDLAPPDFYMQMDICDSRVVLAYSTFYWITSLISLVRVFQSGGCRIMPKRFHPEEALRMIEDLKITHCLLSSKAAREFLTVKDFKKYDTSSLHHFLSGGATITPDCLIRLRQIFKNSCVTNAYGSSEVGPIAGFDLSKDKHLLSELLSVGRCINDTDIKIIDEEMKHELGPNEEGEIWVRSPYATTGYYNMDSSSTFDSEGFLKTGDIGYYDEKECLFITRRCDEIFKNGVLKVVPSQWEVILQEHPAIEDVAVFGLPQENGDLYPAACIVLKTDSVATAEEIGEFLVDKMTSCHRLEGGIKFVDKLPRTPSSKLKRRELFDLFVKTN